MVPATRAPTPTAVHATARATVPTRTVVVTRPSTPSTWAHPLSASADHRYARPDPSVTIVHTVHTAPAYWGYRPYWTHWWVHPYYRSVHATAAVATLGFHAYPWRYGWVPPYRPGWVWRGGYYCRGGFWCPGYWAPFAASSFWFGVGWSFAPGWWIGSTYVDGFWRMSDRAGWSWSDGYYLDDGTYVPGYWAPDGQPPREGYVWEPGYWDGKYWVEGFWRPSERPGYRWVSSWLDQDGIQHAGYWEPTEDRPGYVWIPGWFDGKQWIEGYWVTQEQYDQANPDDYKPDEGWDDRSTNPPPSDHPPPAIPVQPQ
jgi:hypothetical protein